MRQTLPKSNILRGYKRFSRVLNEGSSLSGENLLCFVAPSVETNNRNIVVGFSVPKKIIPLAVHRNAIRRLIREAVRKHIREMEDTLKINNRKIDVVLMIKNNRLMKDREISVNAIEDDWLIFQREIEKMI